MAAFDFDQEFRDLALDQAPRVFAVAVQYEVEPGGLDGEIAAWGLAYEDGSAHVVTANGQHPAQPHFTRTSDVVVRAGEGDHRADRVVRRALGARLRAR